MKLRYRLPALLLIAFVFQHAGYAVADSVFQVTLNTQPLIGSDAGPFYVDFQLDGGNGNSVSISQFNFGAGGSAVAASPATYGTIGDASGDISSTLSLDSSGGYGNNEVWQQFIAGDSLSFQVTTTATLSDQNPDALEFNILDQSLSNIPTLGANSQFLSYTYNTGGPTLSTYPNDPGTAPVGSNSGTPIGFIDAPTVSSQISAVPLPASWKMGLELMIVFVIFTRMRRVFRFGTGCCAAVSIQPRAENNPQVARWELLSKVVDDA